LAGDISKAGSSVAAQQSVAQAAKPVLRAEFDRAAPDHQFAVADVDAPPACGPPLRRDVVALALLAHEEDQRFARRAAGVVTRQRTVSGRLQPLQIRPDLGLAEQRQGAQGVG
jgi:membrane-bound lytic murein transglycosylase B